MQSRSSGNCVRGYNITVLNLFDPELQMINTKFVIKSKFKDFLGLWKKFKNQTILVWEYKKIDDHNKSINFSFEC